MPRRILLNLHRLVTLNFFFDRNLYASGFKRHFEIRLIFANNLNENGYEELLKLSNIVVEIHAFSIVLSQNLINLAIEFQKMGMSFILSFVHVQSQIITCSISWVTGNITTLELK